MNTIKFFLALMIFGGLFLSACSGGVPSLEGEWRLVSYGASFAPTLALPDVEASLSFGADGQFSGNVGCNGFGADYTVSGKTINFGAIMSTMMFCESTAEQETMVLGILGGGGLTYEINGDILTLTAADGDTIIVLARK